TTSDDRARRPFDQLSRCDESTRSMRTPSMYSITSTRCRTRSCSMRGMSTCRLPAKFARMRSALSASFRKSISSPMRSAHSSTETLEQLGRALSVALDDGALDQRERNRRDLVGERRERGDVLLGKQVRASGEHLSELHEGGAERPDGRDERLGASSVKLIRAHN